MKENHQDKAPSFNEMEYVIRILKELSKINFLLYQYRPCRKDDVIIYDIENIRHNVVYAQSPLKMNDPFDSRIGFSSEKILDEIIRLHFKNSTMENTHKQFILFLLKYNVLGKLGELVSLLNELKQYLITQRKNMHKGYLTLAAFQAEYLTHLYNKLPKPMKSKFTIETFTLFGMFFSANEDAAMTEESINAAFGMDKNYEDIKQSIRDVKNRDYLPAIEAFLSKMTVSCFSAGGWNNPLMWSHYAYSYTGFCVEYDFSKLKGFIGIIEKIKYSSTRPTLSLKDIGLIGLREVVNDDGTRAIKGVFSDADLKKIVEYLTVKDLCWEYEKEWRIINIEDQPNTPRFIEMPEIKSVTFGINIDPLCKRLLMDVCQEKNIACYDLVLGSDNFSIERKQLSANDLEFDLEKEIKYIVLLTDINQKNVEKLKKMVPKTKDPEDSEGVDLDLLSEINKCFIDCLTDSFFIKSCLIHIYEKSDEVERESFSREALIKTSKNIADYVEQNRFMIENQKQFIQSQKHNKEISEKQLNDLSLQVNKIESLMGKICELKLPDSLA